MSSSAKIGDQIRRNRRRQDQAASDQASIVVDDYSIFGSFIVVGHGEVVVDIDLPVLFIQKPKIFFGSEISQQTELKEGNFPEISVSLFSWKVDVRSPSQRFWVGGRVAARLLFDTPSVVKTPRFDINWNVVGKALSNPVSGLDISSGSSI